MFLKNHWYVAAWAHELGQTLLARKICGEPLVMFRKIDGTPAILMDRCWHRYAPLSAGTLENDQVICGYHGLRFNAEGTCTHIPSQTIPKSACVQSFPAIERHAFIWVWMGDADKADPSLVPDLFQNDDPAWAGGGATLHMQCDYRLVIDNLMDLTHETYVHTASIGHEKLPGTPIEVESKGNDVTVTRWIEDHQPAPFWKTLIKNAYNTDANCDRWQIIKFALPSNIILDVGVAIAGTGARQGDRSQGVNCCVLNSITPETETSCFYFWSLLRNFDLENGDLTDTLTSKNAAIFEEDVAMLEAQQQVIDSAPEVKLVALGIDAGGEHARRILRRLIAAENANAG